jgi:hypothetical protein
MTGLKPKLYKRQFFIDWMQSSKATHPVNCCLLAREKTVDLIISTGCSWLQTILDSFLAFDFIVFLDLHNGNWQAIWNSMVLFYQRGLYFDKAYPPAANIYLKKDNVPHNYILKTLEESLSQLLLSSALPNDIHRKSKREWKKANGLETLKRIL